MTTYLGSKGYTIVKPNEEQIKEIKKDLTIQPKVFGGPKQFNQYPVYRESANKLYVPRFYGETKYGKPTEIRIPLGDDIHVEFRGDLRPYQSNVVNAYVDKVGESGGGLIELACGKGKTVCALNVISRLRKKTLIIVHKEFLMNQWIERITQYLPNMRIGRIQGKKIEIEGNDIVLAMLQSISMKEYASSVFDSFGLTIIDEVHHISSEVFSCALFKIVSNYMLGLSATMERKDGTTNVIKMFLGEVVFKDTDTGEHAVVVQKINYKTMDTEFNEVEKNWKGETKIATMITKICDFAPRNDFIIKVIQQIVKSSHNRQVMVLANNRSLLYYLYETINKMGFASVGYYIGGMKEQDLKETEGKQIVLGTMACAQEALDIPTLNSLIFCTPRTEIEQAVGRILRRKHENPIIVDIVDIHEPFQKQWTKRRCFYKKRNYKIVEADSKDYKGLDTEWKLIYDPKTRQMNEQEEEDIQPQTTQRKCFIKFEEISYD